MSHTPGPWKIEWPDYDEEWSNYHEEPEAHEPNAYLSSKQGKDGWEHFASVVVMVNGEVDEIGEANARLIAASPVMLAALQSLTSVLTERPTTKAEKLERERRVQEAWEEGIAAIALATIGTAR